MGAGYLLVASEARPTTVGLDNQLREHSVARRLPDEAARYDARQRHRDVEPTRIGGGKKSQGIFADEFERSVRKCLDHPDAGDLHRRDPATRSSILLRREQTIRRDALHALL